MEPAARLAQVVPAAANDSSVQDGWPRRRFQRLRRDQGGSRACGERPTEALLTASDTPDVRNGQDLVGLPDLVVDSKATQNNWLTRVEDFPAEFCSVQEGGR